MARVQTNRIVYLQRLNLFVFRFHFHCDHNIEIQTHSFPICFRSSHPLTFLLSFILALCSSLAMELFPLLRSFSTLLIDTATATANVPMPSAPQQLQSNLQIFIWAISLQRAKHENQLIFSKNVSQPLQEHQKISN